MKTKHILHFFLNHVSENLVSKLNRARRLRAGTSMRLSHLLYWHWHGTQKIKCRNTTYLVLATATKVEIHSEKAGAH